MPLFSQHTPQQNGAATLLRRYRPLETRATGGFGSVEICLDTRLQRRVAIKRIPLVAEGMPAPAGSTAAALAEARTASMLQHPNIVSVIDFTYDASFAYLVMEYVDGLSLEEFLAQVDGHSLTYDEEAHIADSLCQALAYAHENGVLHLDIKPANVLIDHSGHVKLADFGMACLTSAAGWGGARGGTIGYMSPEQLDGSVVDERSDLFSLACVLYESLCGGKPFVAASPADSLKRIEAGVETPSELLPDIPASAEHALLQALSPTPESRPVRADDFAETFLSEMGNARQGKKSLARMIARMTSDEMDPVEPTQDDEPTATDPAKGLLGTRYPQARLLLGVIASGLGVAWPSFAILHTMGLAQAPAVLSAIVIGAAGGAAPQIGSALLAAGLFTMIVNSTPLVPALPSLALIAALGTSWWLVWGRTSRHASTALVVTYALSASPSLPADACLVGACLAAYLASPAEAGISCALGMILGRLSLLACTAGGVLGADMLAQGLLDVSFIVPVLICAAGAAGLSYLLDRGWSNYQKQGSRLLFLLAEACPVVLAMGILCLAHPMEIASLRPENIANAFGAGIVSSIIVWVDMYLFGYEHGPSKE